LTSAFTAIVASGIHDYLLKPFTVDQLRDTFAHAQSIISGPAEKPRPTSRMS
jgi:response regulator of citrate/malate metabolism